MVVYLCVIAAILRDMIGGILWIKLHKLSVPLHSDIHRWISVGLFVPEEHSSHLAALAALAMFHSTVVA